MSVSPFRLVSVAVLLVGLAACQRATPPVGDASTPDGAVLLSAAALRAGDLPAWLAAEFPAAELERMSARWHAGIQQQGFSADERADFAHMMAELVADNSQQLLLARIEPKLAEFERDAAARMPMIISVGKGMVVSSIQDSRNLSATQKKQAIATVDAFGDWLQAARFTDRTTARLAIDELAVAAKALQLPDVDALRALSFEQVLERGSIALRATKRIAALYGLDLDATLSALRTQVVAREAARATVRVDYTLFGAALQFDRDMVEVDGRWYGRQVIEETQSPAPPVGEAQAPGAR